MTRGLSTPQRSYSKADLTGQRFGLVTVTSPAPSIGHGARWRCRCDCGAERVVMASTLTQKPPKTHRHCEVSA
jgi:hypothetical protein